MKKYMNAENIVHNKTIDLQNNIVRLTIEIKTSYIDIQQSTIDSHPYSVLIAKLPLPHSSH